MCLSLCGCWVGMGRAVSIILSRINRHTNLICQLRSIMIQRQLTTWEVTEHTLKPHLYKAQPALEGNVGKIQPTNAGFISEAWGLWYVINGIIKFTLFITEFLLFNFEIQVDCRKRADVNFMAVLSATAQGGWVCEAQRTFWRQTALQRRERERLLLVCFEQGCIVRLRTQLFLDFQWDVMGNRKARETDEKYNPRSPLQSCMCSLQKGPS